MAGFTAALAFGMQGWARIKTSMFVTTYKSAVVIKLKPRRVWGLGVECWFILTLSSSTPEQCGRFVLSSVQEQNSKLFKSPKCSREVKKKQGLPG